MPEGEAGSNFFTQKLGPLPLWAWAAIALAILGVIWYLRRSQGASAPSSGAPAAGGGLAAALGTMGGGYPGADGGGGTRWSRPPIPTDAGPVTMGLGPGGSPDRGGTIGDWGGYNFPQWPSGRAPIVNSGPSSGSGSR